LSYSLRRDDLRFVVFCFAKPEDAEAFARRFGGERSGYEQLAEILKTSGHPSALFSTNARCRASAHVGGPDR
jgi:hypothetical protein